MGWDSGNSEPDHIASDLRRVAARYHAHRGQPLGITNAVGELEAARHLGLRLIVNRKFDALDRHGARLFIRSRVVCNVQNLTQLCINGLRLDVPWEAVIVVLLDDRLEARSIYRTSRTGLELAMQQSPFRKSTNRPAFAIKTIINAGTLVWPELMPEKM